MKFTVHSCIWPAQCLPHLCGAGYGYGCILSLCSARWQTQVGTVSSVCCLGATGSGSHQQERLGGIAPSTNSIWLVWSKAAWSPETLSKKLLTGTFHSSVIHMYFLILKLLANLSMWSLPYCTILSFLLMILLYCVASSELKLSKSHCLHWTTFHWQELSQPVSM